MNWIKSNSDIVKYIYSLNRNDTFAVRYGDSLELTEYATVVKGPYLNGKNYYKTDLAEPYNIVAKVELRRNPSADFSKNHSICYNPESEDAYVKKGIGRFNNIKSICTKPIQVCYEPNKTLVAKCKECGTHTKIKLEENGNLDSNSMRSNTNGRMITPCCFSENWETELIEE